MKFEKKYHTRTYELDMRDYIKPTQLIQYMQETAENQMATVMDYTEMYMRERRAFILSRMSTEIYLPIYRFADIKALTWVMEGHAANFPRAYELYCDDVLFARAYSNWALVDVDTKRLIKASEFDMAGYPEDEEPAMRIPKRFRIGKEIEMRDAGEVEVGYSVTDINRHLNNTQYYNMLYDRIPEVDEYVLSSMNIRYIHEAPFGSKVEIKRSEMINKAERHELVEEIDSLADAIIFFRTETSGNANSELVFGLVHVQ